MILLVGDVARGHRDREAFQEVHFPTMFAPLAKWSAIVDGAARVPELLSHAFYAAVSGRPGPIVLTLPEDMLVEQADVEDAPPYRVVQAHPSPDDLAQLRELVEAAERPFALVGGGGWTPQAAADMTALVEAWGIPTGGAFRRQDVVDNRSRFYVGDVGLGINPKLAARIRDADLLLVAGARLGEATTSGYTLVEPPRPRQRLVHVHQDPDELGRVYAPDLPIVSGMPQFASAARLLEPVDGSRWAEWAAAARADYEENLRHTPSGGDLVDMGEVMAYLRRRLPDDAILANGAGNFSVWAHRFSCFRRFPTQLAPTSGAMGYGLPAAVAAKLVHPERLVVCFSGDGDFLMTGQELATAVQYALPLVILVVNNGMYGTIRMHQEREYPERVLGTALVNPDFAAYARAFGAHGALVERTEDFAVAFEDAVQAGRPALLELRVDPEAITPRATISSLRRAARP
jgi:acetolactate synthase-1/2/3 large subunit